MNKKLLREIIIYGIIGVIAAIFDFGIFSILTKIYEVNIYIANFISMNVGMLISFILNTFFNFKKTDQLLKRFLRFISVGYLGIIISYITIFIGRWLLKNHDIEIKIISMVIVAMFQFILNKFITFKD